MNAIKNKVQLVGHLGENPTIKTFEGDRKLAQFSMATNETFKNKEGEKVVETQWHKIVIWGKLAEVAEKYLIKGSEVIIEGKITYRKYDNKEGVTQYFTEINCNELMMVGAKATA
ncbi:MAG: single-strand DNA-binding protein [Sphingobacteriales bacterium]|jgi:single-strand DNA-binding protein